MKFGKTSDHPIRLFERGSGSFVSEIHESFALNTGVPGRISQGSLSGGYLNHYSYADTTDYFLRFNLYTTRIAENHAKNGRKPPPRAFHILRPFWEFLSRYLFRLGFLDGYPGYCYALYSSVYTFVKYEKLRELIHRKSTP